MRNAIINDKTLNFKIILLVAGFALAFGTLTGCPKRWTPCECEDDEFTLTVTTPFGGGTVTKNPNKQYYKKGEYVTLTFTPSEDGHFLWWLCEPRSHLASDCENTSTGVYITDNTTVIALGDSKARTLNVNWNPSFGTVVIPPGGQGSYGSASFTAPVDSGDTITLHAVPNPGYFTKWHGNGNWIWSGKRYSDSVTIKVNFDVSLTAQFIPSTEYPTNMKSLSVSTTGGGADVFSAASKSGSYNAGPYLSGSVSGPDKFAFSITSHPGYAFNYFTWVADSQTWYSTSTGFPYRNEGNYTAHLSNLIKLDIETEGQGVVTSNQFRWGWNPKPYQGMSYGTSLTPLPNANQVNMTATPCPGWIFDRWEYKNAQGQTEQYFSSSLPIYMNWWTGAGIHVPDGHSTFNVKAVFTKAEVIGFHFQNGSGAGWPCATTGYSGTLSCNYQWSSSTGKLWDLDGKVIEVLCYDSSVTEAEIVDCLNNHRFTILYESNAQRTSCTATTAYMDPLWACAEMGLEGNPHVPSRFYFFAKSNASDGHLTDGHILDVPCWLSFYSAQYTIYQYYYHVPVCGEIKKVGGPFEITRTSYGDQDNISVSKHHLSLTTNCETEWKECDSDVPCD